MSAATIRSPLRSMRPTISPISPRSTASGLAITNVRFMAGETKGRCERGSASGRAAATDLRRRNAESQLQVRTSRTDDVERSGDKDRILRLGEATSSINSAADVRLLDDVRAERPRCRRDL